MSERKIKENSSQENNEVDGSASSPFQGIYEQKL